MNVNKSIAKTLIQTERAHSEALKRDASLPAADWPVWYATYLLDSTDFQLHTNRDWTKEDLTQALKHLDAAYSYSSQRHHWSKYYAQRLTE